MKYIAMFLPQFHECEYNSQWWGKGFTEWNNVRAARPLYPGHRQPRVPADGYYDLTSAGELERQARQAKDHGIDAFSIYHYWYEGRRPLGRPLELILNNPSLEIEYSLCWANHSWTRSWKNRSGSLDVLIEQTYEADRASRDKHFAYLLRCFSDPRYTKIGEKPLFQIYLPSSIPDCKTFIGELRDYVAGHLGTDLHVSAMVTAWQKKWDFLSAMDSVTLFQPSLALFSGLDIFGPQDVLGDKYLGSRIRAGPPWLKRFLYRLQDALPDRHSLYSYDAASEMVEAQYERATHNAPVPVIPMAFVDFDNTPRYRSRAKILEGVTVVRFADQLTKLAAVARGRSPGDVLFINAWNEWGEGMYLQPEGQDDRSRLLAVRDSLS
jgi:hypothetical protein